MTDLPAVNDWVTNDDKMLGEPHQVLAILDDGDLLCIESGGHTIKINPSAVKVLSDD